MVTGSTSAVWALPAGPGAAVAEETLQPSWALAGEGGGWLGSPKPSPTLMGAQPLKPTLSSNCWAGSGQGMSLGASKPHPVCAESSRLGGVPGGWCIPKGLSLLVSLSRGLPVALG